MSQIPDDVSGTDDPEFTEAEWNFQTRYENGFDLQSDAKYNRCVEMYHLCEDHSLALLPSPNYTPSIHCRRRQHHPKSERVCIQLLPHVLEICCYMFLFFCVRGHSLTTLCIKHTSCVYMSLLWFVCANKMAGGVSQRRGELVKPVFTGAAGMCMWECVCVLFDERVQGWEGLSTSPG